MNCVPDFGNWLWKLGIFVGSGGILFGTLEMDDEWRCCDQRKLWCIWFVVCMVVELGMGCFIKEAAYFPKFCLWVLAIYFVVCSTMDSMLTRVNNFMQYVGIGGGILWVLYYLPQKDVGTSLLFFALVQYGIFRRMYGGADVAAFLICALYLAGQNKKIEAYLFHMAVCYFVLALVQGGKGNISPKGNLKKPVPLYPYILIGFLLIFYQ